MGCGNAVLTLSKTIGKSNRVGLRCWRIVVSQDAYKEFIYEIGLLSERAAYLGNIVGSNPTAATKIEQ